MFGDMTCYFLKSPARIILLQGTGVGLAAVWKVYKICSDQESNMCRCQRILGCRSILLSMTLEPGRRHVDCICSLASKVSFPKNPGT